MLNNLLRVFITKQAINKMQEEQQKRHEEQALYENQISQITNTKELDAYLKQVEQIEKNRVRYCSRPIMAEEIAINARLLFPIIIFLFLFVEFGAIGLFLWEAIEYNSYENFPSMIVLVIAMYVMFSIYIYILNYLENTRCLYYSDRICIKKYRKKDTTITYDEVKGYIKKKKVKVHNGRFEYPYKSGKIYVYTWGNSVSDGFYKFINEKCEVKMPRIEKKDKDVVRRTGIGWACYFLMAIPFFVFELFLVMGSTIVDYGLRHTSEEILIYIVDMLLCVKSGFLGLIGLGFVLIGLVLKILFYFVAKKYFKDCEDIKVSLF